MKKVTKHWGHELWINEGALTPYALKRILFKAGNRTSLQVHQSKIETNYVLSGTGKLLLSKDVFNIEDFLKTGMTAAEVLSYESTLQVYDLYEGISFDVLPGHVHRVIALTDLEFIEVSTTELDDVIRLQDDKGRNHGRIISEHQ